MVLLENNDKDDTNLISSLKQTTYIINRSIIVIDHDLYNDKHDKITYTLWLFNIAMENGPVIDVVDDLPIKNGDFPWLC